MYRDLSNSGAACERLTASSTWAERVRRARAGEALCLAPGIYPGPVEVPFGVTLFGPKTAVIKSSGEGTTVRLVGDGARLSGLTVDGSGGRFDTLDAAVSVQARGAAVEHITVRNAVFGILVQKSAAVQIRFNHIIGRADEPHGLRSDAIRLWETHDSLLEGNLVEHSRDIVIWYSRRNRVGGNVVRGGRYGTHLMYSHGATIEGNRFERNVVGVFVMYSRDVALARNVMADASGAAGVGLGVKESGNLIVRGNAFVHNTVGAYLDTTPLQDGDHNVFERNAFRLGQVGVVFHSSQRRNTFRGNTFADNVVTVRVEGGGDALEVLWQENYFDDYAGYDLNGDGRGDIPYELRSLSATLSQKHPELAFLHGTPALALVSFVSHVAPLLTPRPILRDGQPKMTPHTADAEVSFAR